MKIQEQTIHGRKYGQEDAGYFFIGAWNIDYYGADKTVETWLLGISPDWLVSLTTYV